MLCIICLDDCAKFAAYRWQSTNPLDGYFLDVIQCKLMRRIRRRSDKIPLHETSWVWNIHRNNICLRFYEMQWDNRQQVLPQPRWNCFLEYNNPSLKKKDGRCPFRSLIRIHKGLISPILVHICSLISDHFWAQFFSRHSFFTDE